MLEAQSITSLHHNLPLINNNTMSASDEFTKWLEEFANWDINEEILENIDLNSDNEVWEDIDLNSDDGKETAYDRNVSGYADPSWYTIWKERAVSEAQDWFTGSIFSVYSNCLYGSDDDDRFAPSYESDADDES